VKKLAVIVSVVAVLLVLLGFGADRATAAVAEHTISDRIGRSLAGVSSVSTSIQGVPVLTQVAHGSLDHVTVTLHGVPSGAGPTIDTVVADLYGVSTSSPRTAQRVVAQADIGTAELQRLLGDSWSIAPDGDALAVRWTGGLPLTARLVPAVRDGRIALDLASVSVLGVQVDGSAVPAAVTDRINDLAASVGRLPLGLTPTAVSVTPQGVRLTASGTDVDLESA
jgi:hypothetical protein